MTYLTNKKSRYYKTLITYNEVSVRNICKRIINNISQWEQNAYINEFHPKIVEWYLYGAPKVQELGRLLAELYKENKVSRCRHYCKIRQNGYPKWFYNYDK